MQTKLLGIVFGVLLTSTWAFAKTLFCYESCQRFDQFTHQCTYKASCTADQNRLSYRYCEKFDPFTQDCASEATRTTPFKVNPYLPAPACEEACQYFDSFTGDCLYRLDCEFSEIFTKQTKCEYWDQFSKQCQSEMTTWAANVVGR